MIDRPLYEIRDSFCAVVFESWTCSNEQGESVQVEPSVASRGTGGCQNSDLVGEKGGLGGGGGRARKSREVLLERRTQEEKR